MQTTTHARAPSRMAPAMARSPEVTPCAASTRSSATCARSIWRCAIITARSSGAPETLPRRRIPAVSTSTNGLPSHSTTVSTGSRVVPGWAETSTRSAPTMRLSSDDLPTLGRPTMAMVGPGRFALQRLLGRDQIADALAQLLDAGAVLGRDQERLEPQPVELPHSGASLAHVALVDHQHDRLAAAAQRGEHLLVAGHRPGAAVDHEQEHVALVDREQHLRAEAERILALGHQAAGVDEVDRGVVVELRGLDDAVAGDPGQVVHDGATPSHQPVEEGRFADVGAADDGDRGPVPAASGRGDAARRRRDTHRGLQLLSTQAGFHWTAPSGAKTCTRSRW